MSQANSYQDFKNQCKKAMPKAGEGPYRFIPTKDKPWSDALNFMQQHDSAWCKERDEDLNTLLTFSAIFSAVVTAFVIESYKWLDTDPSTETVQLLRTIALQLNSSLTLPSVDNTKFSQKSAISINGFWFLSLVLSLTASLLAIQSKQWIHRYQRYGLDGEDSNSVCIRQLRFESWGIWHVNLILASLPVLLEISLFLFLIGVVQLLWDRNLTLGILITTFVVASFLLYLITALAPAVAARSINPVPPPSDDNPDIYSRALCSFKSPQSYIFSLLFSREFRSWADPEKKLMDDLHVRRFLFKKAAKWLQDHITISDQWANNLFHVHSEIVDDATRDVSLPLLLLKDLKLDTLPTSDLFSHAVELWLPIWRDLKDSKNMDVKNPPVVVRRIGTDSSEQPQPQPDRITRRTALEMFRHVIMNWRPKGNDSRIRQLVCLFLENGLGFVRRVMEKKGSSERREGVMACLESFHFLAWFCALSGDAIVEEHRNAVRYIAEVYGPVLAIIEARDLVTGSDNNAYQTSFRAVMGEVVAPSSVVPECSQTQWKRFNHRFVGHS